MASMNIRYAVIAYFVAVIVFISIWLPEVRIYHVDIPSITKEVIQESKKIPSQSVLDELSKMTLGPPLNFSNSELLSAADSISNGFLQLPGYEAISINIPFDPQDLSKGLPTWRLHFASLVAPDILLDAYAMTGKEDYFKLAQDMILAWAKYEMSQWLPNDFLWNDHAIAARIIVLGKFWALYRKRSDFDADTAKILIELVSHSGELLGKDEHYTFATNHGIMQNVALLHIASVFPALPNAEELKQKGLDRLHDQMEFYINKEGVVLEHSAEYHHHGMIFIARILRYLTLNNIDIPSSWINKYNKSKEFTALISRPDGSLPIFGNTKGNISFDSIITSPDIKQGKTSRLYRMNEWNPVGSSALYPVAGYSVWWNNLNIQAKAQSLSQTILTWSYFPGHGHKLADEMSVLIWAGDQTWITNTGYWPYGVPGRKNVDSWEGSNAPHLLNEPWNSARHTELLNYAVKDEISLVHLRRTGPEGYSVDRQVVYVEAGLWLILDNASDRNQRKTTTTWTFSHDLNLTAGLMDGQFHFSQPGHGLCMTSFLVGSENTSVNTYKGSMDPFAGWVVIGNKPMAAPSLVVEQPSDNSWAVTVLSLEDTCEQRFATQPVVVDWQNSDRWKVNLPLISGDINIERLNHSILMTTDSSDTEKMHLLLDSVFDTSIEKQLIYDAFHESAQKTNRYNQNIYQYRIKISYLLLGMLLIQELFFLICSRFFISYLIPLRILSYSFWIIASIYLSLIYFKS